MIKKHKGPYIKGGRCSVGNNTSKVKLRAHAWSKAINKLYVFQYRDTKEEKYRNVPIKYLSWWDPDDIDAWAYEQDGR